jgi:hypothetical protein
MDKIFFNKYEYKNIFIRTLPYPLTAINSPNWCLLPSKQFSTLICFLFFFIFFYLLMSDFFSRELEEVAFVILPYHFYKFTFLFHTLNQPPLIFFRVYGWLLLDLYSKQRNEERKSVAVPSIITGLKESKNAQLM